MGRFCAWSVGLFLAFVGSSLAHTLAYVAVVPDVQPRAHLLEESGHSYFSYLPFLFGLLGATAVLGLLARVAAADPATVLPRWPIALLPAVTFAMQEHVERLGHDGALPWHAVLEPTFLPGLLLQLPFGILAFVVAQALLRGAERLGVFLHGRVERAGTHRKPGRCIGPAPFVRAQARTTGRITRGPPASLAA